MQLPANSQQSAVNSEQSSVNSQQSAVTRYPLPVTEQQLFTVDCSLVTEQPNPQSKIPNGESVTDNCSLLTGNCSLLTALPCLDSTQACIEQLTQAAIAHSGELKTLNDRIGLLERRLGLAGDGIDYAESKLWTNYIPDPNGGNFLNILNPISWLKNLLGGGDIQRERLAITDLEIKKADIEAARAELERKREEVKSQLQEQILTLVLNYEAATRQQSLIASQLKNQQILSQVVEIDYRFGGSSTDAYLAAVEKRERLQNQLTQSQIAQGEALRKILSLTGFAPPISIHF